MKFIYKPIKQSVMRLPLELTTKIPRRLTAGVTSPGAQTEVSLWMTLAVMGSNDVPGRPHSHGRSLGPRPQDGSGAQVQSEDLHLQILKPEIVHTQQGKAWITQGIGQRVKQMIFISQVLALCWVRLNTKHSWQACLQEKWTNHILFWTRRHNLEFES